MSLPKGYSWSLQCNCYILCRCGIIETSGYKVDKRRLGGEGSVEDFGGERSVRHSLIVIQFSGYQVKIFIFVL